MTTWSSRAHGTRLSGSVASLCSECGMKPPRGKIPLCGLKPPCNREERKTLPLKYVPIAGNRPFSCSAAPVINHWGGKPAHLRGLNKIHHKDGPAVQQGYEETASCAFAPCLLVSIHHATQLQLLNTIPVQEQ